jgi:hypothetical protein
MDHRPASASLWLSDGYGTLQAVLVTVDNSRCAIITDIIDITFISDISAISTSTTTTTTKARVCVALIS